MQHLVLCCAFLLPTLFATVGAVMPYDDTTVPGRLRPPRPSGGTGRATQRGHSQRHRPASHAPTQGSAPIPRRQSPFRSWGNRRGQKQTKQRCHGAQGGDNAQKRGAFGNARCGCCERVGRRCARCPQTRAARLCNNNITSSLTHVRIGGTVGLPEARCGAVAESATEESALRGTPRRGRPNALLPMPRAITPPVVPLRVTGSSNCVGSAERNPTCAPRAPARAPLVRFRAAECLFEGALFGILLALGGALRTSCSLAVGGFAPRRILPRAPFDCSPVC